MREARDGDADGLISLISACYAEYPGCVLDVDGEEPWLRAPATATAARRGRLWVAESSGPATVGSAGSGGALAVGSAGSDGAPAVRATGSSGAVIVGSAGSDGVATVRATGPGAVIVGSAGLRPARQGTVVLHALYVARGARRRGLGAQLVGLVEAEARSRGSLRVALWSDTRFADAHRLYQRLGYLRTPSVRELHDASRSLEYQFVKQLSPA